MGKKTKKVAKATETTQVTEPVTTTPSMPLVLNSKNRPACPTTKEDLPIPEAKERIMGCLRDLGGSKVGFVDLKNHTRLLGPVFVQAYHALLSDKKLLREGGQGLHMQFTEVKAVS